MNLLVVHGPRSDPYCRVYPCAGRAACTHHRRDPAEWIAVAELEVVSGCVWAGDPLCMNEEDGCSVKLPAGTYVLAAQGMDFGGFRVVGRVRVFPKNMREDRLKIGPAIGKKGSPPATSTVS